VERKIRGPGGIKSLEPTHAIDLSKHLTKGQDTRKTQTNYTAGVGEGVNPWVFKRGVTPTRGQGRGKKNKKFV